MNRIPYRNINAARAQQTAMPVIGFLAPVTPPEEFLVAFKRGLREHGLPEGQKISVAYRNAAGMFARLPGLAAELVDLKVSLIVSWTTPAAVAAKQATQKPRLKMPAAVSCGAEVCYPIGRKRRPRPPRFRTYWPATR